MTTSLVAYTYILECSNGAYYVGSTTDMERRLEEHQAGLGGKYTSSHLPVKLVYWEEYQTIEEAFERERQIHGWTRAKKQALINGDAESLIRLCKRNGPSTGSRTVPADLSGSATNSGTVPVGELVEPPTQKE